MDIGLKFKSITQVMLAVMLSILSLSTLATPWDDKPPEEVVATLDKKFAEGKYSAKGADTCLDRKSVV